MAEWKPAAICERGDVVDWKDQFEDLVSVPNCPTCGKEVHATCPNCGANSVRAGKVQYEDGSTDWRRDEHCMSCGEVFPWGPNWLARKLRSRRVTSSGPNRPTPRQKILTHRIRERLKETRYGNEVLRHIDDGDECYKYQLWHPALAMYIHAIEWAMITYLEDKEIIDVVEEGNQGNYFYLAGKEPNLLDTLREHVDIGQKTIERIEDVNRSERRWMAHHRSGKTHREDVDIVRARLGELLKTLFENEQYRSVSEVDYGGHG